MFGIGRFVDTVYGVGKEPTKPVTVNLICKSNILSSVEKSISIVSRILDDVSVDVEFKYKMLNSVAVNKEFKYALNGLVEASFITDYHINSFIERNWTILNVMGGYVENSLVSSYHITASTEKENILSYNILMPFERTFQVSWNNVPDEGMIVKNTAYKMGVGNKTFKI